MNFLFRSGSILITAILLVLLGSGAGSKAQSTSTEPTVDAATRKAVIEMLAEKIVQYYVFPESAVKIRTEILGRLSKGDYDRFQNANELAKQLTEDLRALSHDKHLGVEYSEQLVRERPTDLQPTDEERERNRIYSKRVNYGFSKADRMPGNIGYIELTGFFDAELGAKTAASAMAFIANTDALIIDVRENEGGNPSMQSLISAYLFGNKPVQLSSIHWRDGDRTVENWTKPISAAERYEGKDVYVLTSGNTFSAAEAFSYDLKNLKRAVIVGETTGGGANPGRSAKLSDHFRVFIPMGRAVNPITKTNWEGTGVTPDVAVPSSVAFETAYIMALKEQLKRTADKEQKDALIELIDRQQKSIDKLEVSKPNK